MKRREGGRERGREGGRVKRREGDIHVHVCIHKCHM